MKDEIVAGMKNALARGQSLEQAAQSFVNAGYNPQEVAAAKQSLSNSGASQIVKPMPEAPQADKKPAVNKPEQKKNLPAKPEGVEKIVEPIKKDNKIFVIVLLVFVLLAILVGGSFLAYYFL